MGAISAGWAARLSGVFWPKLSTSMVEGMSGVQTGPGATAFTRMPRSASSCESPFVKLAIAALLAAECSRWGLGWYAWMDVVLMMAEPGGIFGIAAWQR